MKIEEMTITQRLAAITGEIGAIGKTETNPQLRFAYRGIDSIRNKLNPLFTKYQVVMTCQILSWDVDEREVEKETSDGKKYLKVAYHCKAHAKYIFSCDAGELSTEVIASSIDFSDKAPTQVMSMLQKSAYIQIFCLQTEDEKDPDSQTPEVKRPAQKRTAQVPGIKTFPDPFEPQVRTIPDDKFSLSALKEAGWDGKISDSGQIVLKGKGGKAVTYQLSDEQSWQVSYQSATEQAN